MGSHSHVLREDLPAPQPFKLTGRFTLQHKYGITFICLIQPSIYPCAQSHTSYL